MYRHGTIFQELAIEVMAELPTDDARHEVLALIEEVRAVPRTWSDVPLTPTLLSSHPVRRRPTRMWSGRGSWRPGGARHCTNDLDAMGRVCSALPGSMADGMGAPTLATMCPRPGTAPPPTRCRPIPRRRHCFDRKPPCAVQPRQGSRPLMAASAVRPVTWCGISGPYERRRIWQRRSVCRRRHDPASFGDTTRLWPAPLGITVGPRARVGMWPLRAATAGGAVRPVAKTGEAARRRPSAPPRLARPSGP